MSVKKKAKKLLPLKLLVDRPMEWTLYFNPNTRRYEAGCRSYTRKEALAHWMSRHSYDHNAECADCRRYDENETAIYRFDETAYMAKLKARKAKTKAKRKF